MAAETTAPLTAIVFIVVSSRQASLCSDAAAELDRPAPHGIAQARREICDTAASERVTTVLGVVR